MEIAQLKCSDGRLISYRVWIPKDGKIDSVLHLFHGMAEHSERYNRFAECLNNQNIALYAQDHRGHGLSIENDLKGYFGPNEGWERVMYDAYELSLLIKERHKDADLFLFGHSMGSFLVRSLIAIHHELYDGAILSGTGYSQGLKGKAGKLLAKMRSVGSQASKPDKLLDNLSFGSFSKHFEPVRTPFDWLSNDPAEVDAYINDPLCGFVCTSRFFVDLLEGIEMANNKKLISQIPKDFPLYIISGEEDPVGDFGEGVKKVAALYQSSGMSDVTLQLLRKARHEILNEYDRKAFAQMIIKWILRHQN